MDHMSGVVNLNEMSISDDRQSLLLIGPLGVTALFAIDDEDRAFNATKKLHGLRGVKGLGRNRAMEWIKFPDPFALSILFHPRTRQGECLFTAQTRVCLLELLGARRHTAILAEMIAATIVKLPNPFLHTHGRILKLTAAGPDAFEQREMLPFLRKGAGVEKRDRAAHGMADKLAPLHAQRADHTIEIENIVRKVVITASAHPAAIAMATAVRRDNPERLVGLILKQSDKRLPTSRLIQKTVD